MEELVKLVSQKIGLSEEKSHQAVETVLDYHKERLPDPIAGQLDSVVSSGKADDLLKGLGGLLGDK